MGPIHSKTCLREAYASFRGAKGSLRGGVLFGVAYEGGYARAILSAKEKSALKQLLLGLLRLHFLVFCTFCGFISFHFGLLCLPQKSLVCVAKGSTAASFIPPKTWGAYGWGYQVLTQGLRGGYAALTRGELVASHKRNSQLEGHQIPQKSQSLIFQHIIHDNMRKLAYARLLTR